MTGAPTTNDDTPAAAAAAAGPGWGEGLAYPAWMQALMTPLHDGFGLVNRFVSVPALRAGLGRYMSNPVSGYLMILRTRGRRTGELRDAPLGYLIRGEHVYCIAGFGRRTHWYRNILDNPHVEVILPGRAFSGIAEEVADPVERRETLGPLLRSMGAVVTMVGLGDPWRDTPDELVRKCEGMPLVRIRATGLAAGPDDAGGWSWAVPAAATCLVVLALLRRRRRAGARHAAAAGDDR